MSTHMHIGRNARVHDCAAHSRISQHQREARRRWARPDFPGGVRARSCLPSQSRVFTPLPLLFAPTPTFCPYPYFFRFFLRLLARGDSTRGTTTTIPRARQTPLAGGRGGTATRHSKNYHLPSTILPPDPPLKKVPSQISPSSKSQRDPRPVKKEEAEPTKEGVGGEVVGGAEW